MSTRRLTALVALTLLTACDKSATPGTEPPTVPQLSLPSTLSTDVIYTWNEIATQFVARMNVPAPLPPTMESQIYAQVNGAIFDAVNTIQRRYRPYAYTVRPMTECSVESLVPTAAFTVLEAIGQRAVVASGNTLSAPLAFVRARYQEVESGNAARHNEDGSATSDDGRARLHCTQIGREIGLAMLITRAADNTIGQGLAPYTSSGLPGAYRATPPFASDATNMHGLSDGQLWSTVQPFIITSAHQFRAPAPYGATNQADAVKTAAYAADFDEVKRLGSATSTARTAEQTDIAFFWMENSPLTWNRAARSIALRRQLGASELAHFLAVLSFAEADAYLVAFDTKYTHAFWRPITAIRFADDDGNPATVADQHWDVASATLGVPTPPIPDYTSGHALAGGAAAAAIETLLGGDNSFTITSTTLPGKSRSFASPSAAATENAESRIFIGYDFRQATETGLRQGLELGRFVATNALPLARRE